MRKIEITAYNFCELPEDIQDILIERYPTVDDERLYDIICDELIKKGIHFENEGELNINYSLVVFTGTIDLLSVLNIVNEFDIKIPKEIDVLGDYILSQDGYFSIEQDYPDILKLRVVYDFSEIGMWAEDTENIDNIKMHEVFSNIRDVLQIKVNEVQLHLTALRNGIIAETTDHNSIKKMLMEDETCFYNADGNIVHINGYSNKG
jgi:hypothetical protein